MKKSWFREIKLITWNSYTAEFVLGRVCYVPSWPDTAVVNDAQSEYSDLYITPHYKEWWCENGAIFVNRKRKLISIITNFSVREHDGPLSRFYSHSASAVWDYILSPNLIQKIDQLPVNSDPLNLWLGCLHTRSLHDVKTLTLDKQSKTIIKAWKSKLVAWTSSNADHSNKFSTNPVTVLTFFWNTFWAPFLILEYFWYNVREMSIC